MSATLATPRPGPSALRVSNGAASTIMLIASLARQDAEDVRALALQMLSVWERLDAETLHPRETDHHAHAPIR